MMVPRTQEVRRVLGLLLHHPIVALLGARQVGKTTLARQVGLAYEGEVHFFDLEHPRDLARLTDPLLALERLSGLIVLDEVQLRPDLFPLLRVLADRPNLPARFLILGSASPQLVRGTSESLAGRVAFHDLCGFGPVDVGMDALDDLWIRGGFPRAFLAENSQTSAEWRRDFIRTFLDRDIPQLGITIAPATLRRFWTMIAHVHGRIWNASELGRAFGVAHTTVAGYLDLLVGTYVVRRLSPWYENLGKRQVRSPKIFFTDSGLLHTLLNLDTREDVESHPVCGASWEGFAMDVVLRRLGARPDECFFWATHAGAELDLLVVRGGHRLGVEFKRSAAPRLTRSMQIARTDLRLDRLLVVHAGDVDYPLADGIDAMALAHVLSSLPRL